jgi:hypothetical protein
MNTLLVLAGLIPIVAILAHLLRRWQSRRAVLAQELERTWEHYAGRAGRPVPTDELMPEALLDRVMALRALWRLSPESLAPWVILPADYPRFQPAVYEVAAQASFRKLYDPAVFVTTVQQTAACPGATEPESRP